ncbi:MAG: PilZ domain-containing protein [Candidatus Omnitrophica bacterium]|nr:PilZ domain-containing protein [Candidatus Omnitrophota bacterium]
MTVAKFSERRSFIRAKRVLSIEYRLVKRGSKKMNEKWHLSITQDMSLGGIAFFTSEKYKKNDVLEVNVVMSGILDVFKGFGKVVRAEEKDPDKAYLIALQFIPQTPKKRPAKTYK